mgnify:FL=1
MATQPSRTTSAAQVYEETAATIQKRIETLQGQLKAHRVNQSLTPVSWGHHGDLAHVDSLLSQINSFLGN